MKVKKDIPSSYIFFNHIYYSILQFQQHITNTTCANKYMELELLQQNAPVFSITNNKVMLTDQRSYRRVKPPYILPVHQKNFFFKNQALF